MAFTVPWTCIRATQPMYIVVVDILIVFGSHWTLPSCRMKIAKEWMEAGWIDLLFLETIIVTFLVEMTLHMLQLRAAVMVEEWTEIEKAASESFRIRSYIGFPGFLKLK